MSKEAADAEKAITRTVYGTALQMGRTISAEHGLGPKKRGLAADTEAVQELPLPLSIGEKRRWLNPL